MANIDRYMMIFVVPLLFIGWKFLKGTKFRRAEDIDLLKDLAEIEEYHRTFVPTKSGYVHPSFCIYTGCTLLTLFLLTHSNSFLRMLDWIFG